MTEKAFQKIKAGLEDARDMLAAAPAAPAQEPVAPDVTARFVTSSGGIHGSQFVPVNAVRISDDGTHLDVDLDYWPPAATPVSPAPVAPAPVAVKALVWEHAADWKAKTSIGWYGIRRYPDGFGAYVPGTSYMDNPDEYYPTLEAAKAAAQADYARRVRACLVDAPVAVGWQTMETAPKDGTEFYAFDRHGCLIRVVYFDHPRRPNCVIEPRTGRNWPVSHFLPLDALPLPAAPGEG